ncbi:PAS domain-containing protein [Mangrovicoccus algicola]|uniref:PAS domain-containing protein n=1 Tax=Mangrovicoccus algicola TaxID=2771008 RepID=A0A8J7CYJ9_9RHOB|nr:PAS domain-containing protein [Mangrovicoccus algicola]MBE3636628.1 PAS domain-containing protein [Mangrovicoccus algicola]
MTLLSALAQFSLVQSRIEGLLAREETEPADLSLLLRQARDLRRAVLEAQPLDQQEAMQKLACIVNLIQRDARLQGFDAEIAALLDVAYETCSAIALPSRSAPVPRRSPDRRPSHFGGSVADYVAFAEGRLTLVDTGYQIVATSEETAQHFGSQQIALMGRPLHEVIGAHRFETRTKPRLDACFAGQPQSYHIAMPDGGTARILRCDMRPVNSGEGTILGALIYMTDVTEQARRLRAKTGRFTPARARHGS